MAGKMPVNILLYTELVIISFVRSLFSPKLNYRVVLSNQLVVNLFGDLSPVPFDYLVSLALNVRVGKIFLFLCSHKLMQIFKCCLHGDKNAYVILNEDLIRYAS